MFDPGAGSPWYHPQLSAPLPSYHESPPRLQRSASYAPQLNLPGPPNFLQAPIQLGPLSAPSITRMARTEPSSPAPSLPPTAFLQRSMSMTSDSVTAEEFAAISPRPSLGDSQDIAPNVVAKRKLSSRRNSLAITGQGFVEKVSREGEIPEVSQWQIVVKGVYVGRRCDNNWINGTKMLNVIKAERDEQFRVSRADPSGAMIVTLTRGKRDGILKNEKEREVVKLGPQNIKGVWIPFERAKYWAEEWNALDLLFPLFEADIDERVVAGNTRFSSPVSEVPSMLSLPKSEQTASVGRTMPKFQNHHGPLPQSYEMASSSSMSSLSDVSASPYQPVMQNYNPHGMFRYSWEQHRPSSFASSPPVSPADFGRRGSHPVYPTESYCSPPPSSFVLPTWSAPATGMIPISPKSTHALSYPLLSPSSCRHGPPLAAPVPRRLAVEQLMLETHALDDDLFMPPAKRLRYD